MTGINDNAKSKWNTSQFPDDDLELIGAFAAPEEQVGGEVAPAFSILVHKGLLLMGDTQPGDKSFTISTEADIRAARLVTGFVWDQGSHDSE